MTMVDRLQFGTVMLFWALGTVGVESREHLASSLGQEHRQRSVHSMDLRPGDCGALVRASLDGVQASTEPVRFLFHSGSSWHPNPWFLGLAALLTCTLAWSIYRTRVAYLLGLERQRTRIAMDLHDEVGSGLASVGILASVLATDSLDECERRQTAAEIAAAAEELGYSLSDIVWSLDPHTATMQEVATRLAEHGDRLFPNGEPELSVRFPRHWPSERLELAVRRNVLLVGLEALHNAVRHAGARAVVLSLLPQPGGLWELAVRDDGVGFCDEMRQSARPNGGFGNGHGNGLRGQGLPGMHRRVEEIGAHLEVHSTCGGGTTVSLRFALSPRPAAPHGQLGAQIRRLLARRLA